MSSAFLENLNDNFINTEKGIIEFFGPLTREELSKLNMEEGLNNFREADKQHEALMTISEFDEGKVFAACHDKTIVGYVTFHPPEFRRWADSGIPELLELGGIEVSTNYRGLVIGKNLLKWTFGTYDFESRIVISIETCYNWKTIKHNSIWEHRSMLKHIMGLVGLNPRDTDDPEVIEHMANMLLVRVGDRVSPETASRFEKLLLKNQIIF
ncbi:GNAT family N-acetyltransferase [Natranaerofaba carboxydovora]|uniref:GNAT family N-acetyltransferase n=1 Tax=Natranaerofaba carboxydovora TaxID=2742683 RepID=UPI001F12A876|nr:GNAT family N-acetyltransferase [Natranaerofaba carboxydovora]UMZ74378.1 Acetoin utilization protein AcuA [Natranaerofaba carboxydovora]